MLAFTRVHNFSKKKKKVSQLAKMSKKKMYISFYREMKYARVAWKGILQSTLSIS